MFYTCASCNMKPPANSYSKKSCRFVLGARITPACSQHTANHNVPLWVNMRTVAAASGVHIDCPGPSVAHTKNSLQNTRNNTCHLRPRARGVIQLTPWHCSTAADTQRQRTCTSPSEGQNGGANICILNSGYLQMCRAAIVVMRKPVH